MTKFNKAACSMQKKKESLAKKNEMVRPEDPDELKVGKYTADILTADGEFILSLPAFYDDVAETVKAAKDCLQENSDYVKDTGLVPSKIHVTTVVAKRGWNMPQFVKDVDLNATEAKKPVCSMQKKIESFKKNESAVGRKFYDEFIEPRAREILEEYDVNEAQGGMCDYWYNIGDGVEDIERDDRSGFFSYNDGGVQKTWMTTPFMLAGGGYLDPKTEPEYDRLRKDCEDDYREECEKNGVECDFSSEEYYEFEDRWSEEGLEIFAYAEIMLYSRNSDRDDYTLIARISRSFDYTYGRNPQDDLNIEMDLTSEQFTKENADKFFAAVEEAFANYSFDNGDKEINVKAD